MYQAAGGPHKPTTRVRPTGRGASFTPAPCVAVGEPSAFQKIGRVPSSSYPPRTEMGGGFHLPGIWFGARLTPVEGVGNSGVERKAVGATARSTRWTRRGTSLIHPPGAAFSPAQQPPKLLKGWT